MNSTTRPSTLPVADSTTEGRDQTFPAAPAPRSLPALPSRTTPVSRHESIIPLELHTDMGVFKTRIWRIESTPFAVSDPMEFAAVVKRFKEPLTAKSPHDLMRQIAEAITAIGGVRKVEVLIAETRRGIIHYPAE